MGLRKENILMVDDDVGILELLQRHLQSLGYHTFKALSVKEALFILKDSPIDLLITDIQMPEVDGLQLVRYAEEHYPGMPKLVITGYPSVAGAQETFRSGAADYLTKPFTREELKQAVRKALASDSRKPDAPTAPTLSTGAGYAEIVGDSQPFRNLVEIISRVRDNRATLLVHGESGTGKELVARAVHYSGKFARGPFVAVNCAAIPENLQEAELFGYVKGAFTDARETRTGFFQAAERGTLFLDEIGSASQAVQAKLLRALQEKEITKVGSRKTEKVDLRVIAATNSNLREAIAKKEFREDLFYRLTVVEIEVPPLRDRKSDIPLLTTRFLQKYGVEYRDRLLKIDPEALQILQDYHWPGNIRELENVIQRAVIMSDGTVGPEHLPGHLKFQIDFPQDGFASLREMERDYVRRVLAHTGGNKTRAAEILQIDRKTLREKLK